mmetsp:Transcript_2904/g.10189  ORF Transcript_2904/g.10189 Transcript_2904/m.10189 type:complete len:267 (-) Transcript_2904:9-809(-)
MIGQLGQEECGASIREVSESHFRPRDRRSLSGHRPAGADAERSSSSKSEAVHEREERHAGLVSRCNSRVEVHEVLPGHSSVRLVHRLKQARDLEIVSSRRECVAVPSNEESTGRGAVLVAVFEDQLFQAVNETRGKAVHLLGAVHEQLLRAVVSPIKEEVSRLLHEVVRDLGRIIGRVVPLVHRTKVVLCHSWRVPRLVVPRSNLGVVGVLSVLRLADELLLDGSESIVLWRLLPPVCAAAPSRRCSQERPIDKGALLLKQTAAVA